MKMTTEPATSTHENAPSARADLQAMRIAYVPYRADLLSAGDRRRFPYFARRESIDFEVWQEGRDYDLIVATNMCDLTRFHRMPRGGARLVLDLCDSYFHMPRYEPRSLLRGPGKFLLGQHRHLEWSYHTSLERMCARADAVVCSTPEQEAKITPFSNNVHPILDFHPASELKTKKTQYQTQGTVHIAWEGQAGNLFTVGTIREALVELARKRPIGLHLVTDLTFRRFNGPVPATSTQRLAGRLFRGITWHLYSWNPTTFASILTSCDLGIIPMALDRSVYRGKAENKLLLMWRLGLPTVTSSTYAYSRTMKAAGLDDHCVGAEDWARTLDRLTSSEQARRENVEKGSAYAMSEHGEERVAERWYRVLKSVI